MSAPRRLPSPAAGTGRLALALLLAAMLAGDGLAADTTSQTCLRRCLATCAEQGRGKDEACLRPCLKDCPVHCGTVDSDCALECARKAPADPVRKEERAPDPLLHDRTDVAARCAEPCTVKPYCRPVAYDTGPAELNAPAQRAPAPKGGDKAAARVGGKRFEPKGRQFSLELPPGWTLDEQDRLAEGGNYELTLLARGAALLDYARIGVRWTPGPHRTLRRFLADLEHPAFGPPGGGVAAVRGTLPGQPEGQEVWRAESRTTRSLLGTSDSVPLLVRTLALPQPGGYFVLVLETPEATAESNIQVFERLVASFRPQVKAAPPAPALAEAERAVWAGFFRSRGRIDRPGAAGAAPALPDLDPPREYLEHTAKARLALGRTIAAPTLHPDVLADLVRGCGHAPDPELLRAWDAVRGQQAIVTDDILLPEPGEHGLDIQEGREAPSTATAELMAPSARQGRLRPPSGPGARLAASGGVAAISRVAFSADGALALAYVALGQTSPGTSHFVLLRRVGEGQDGRWVLCGAAQKNMIIF